MPPGAPRLPPPSTLPFPPALLALIFALIRDAARKALLDVLDTIRGRKALVLEAPFAAPLGLVADALTLKEHGVEV